MKRPNIYFSQKSEGGLTGGEGGYNAGKRVYPDEETQHNLKDSDKTGDQDGGPGNGAGNAGNAGNAGGLGGGNSGGMAGTHLVGGFEGEGPEKAKDQEQEDE